MGASGYVHVECRVIKRTDRAALINADGFEHWVPLSVLAPGDAERIASIKPGASTEITISIQEWFAAKNDIEGE